jgi:hypothetical protein
MVVLKWLFIIFLMPILIPVYVFMKANCTKCGKIQISTTLDNGLCPLCALERDLEAISDQMAGYIEEINEAIEEIEHSPVQRDDDQWRIIHDSNREPMPLVWALDSDGWLMVALNSEEPIFRRVGYG